MATQGANVERHPVTQQPREIKYEAKEEGHKAKKVKAAKNATGSN